MKHLLKYIAAILLVVAAYFGNNLYDKACEAECVKALKSNYDTHSRTCISPDGLIIKYYVMG